MEISQDPPTSRSLSTDPHQQTAVVLSSKLSQNVAMFIEIITMAILCFALLFANAAYLSWEDDISFWDDPWEFPEESGDGTMLTWLGSTEVWADLWNWLSQPRKFVRTSCLKLNILLSSDQTTGLSYLLRGSHSLWSTQSSCLLDSAELLELLQVSFLT